MNAVDLIQQGIGEVIAAQRTQHAGNRERDDKLTVEYFNSTIIPCIFVFMNYSYRWLIAIIIACWISHSCTFTPNEEYVNPIEPHGLGQVSITLNEYDDRDTIYLWGPADFFYDIEIDSGRIKSLKVVFAGLDYPQTSVKGKFGIEGSLLKTGTYELRIEFIATPGTGSLADKVGAEDYQVYRTWILKIDVSPPPTPILRLSKQDGYLAVSWDPYTKPNFVGYQIHVKYSNKELTIHYDNPNLSNWVDSSYVGFGLAEYKLTIRNTNGERSQTSRHYTQLLVTGSYDPSDTVATLNLPVAAYGAAFDYYSLSEGATELARIRNKNDTTISVKIKNIGYNYTTGVVVSCNPKDPTMPKESFGFRIDQTIRIFELPRPINKKYFNKDLNSIIGYWNSGQEHKFYRIDPTSLVITDSSNTTTMSGHAVPYGGRYIYFGRSKKIVQYDLQTHEEIEHPLRGVVLSASSNQLVAFYWFDVTIGKITYNFSVHDLINDKEVIHSSYSRSELEEPARTPSLAHGGAFLDWNLVSHSLYSLGSGTTTFVGQINVQGYHHGFRPDDDTEYITYWLNTVKIIDSNTATLKRTITAPMYANFSSYDPVYKRLIFCSENEKKIYSIHIDTGEIKTYNYNASSANVLAGIVFIGPQSYFRLY